MPIVLAFIAKDWKYLFIIAALLGVSGWIYHRGETHIEAADAKVIATRTAHNKETADEVKAKVAAALADYDALSPLPVPYAVPKLVCHASGSGAVLQSAATASSGNAAGAGVSVGAASSDKGFDPAPAVSATATAADVEIEHLQKKVKLLQDLVVTYQGAGLVGK